MTTTTDPASAARRCIAVWLLAAALPISFAAAQDDTAGDELEVLDRIAAIVNDGVILHSDLQGELNSVVLQLRRADRRVPPDDVLRKQVLERLVVAQAQLQRARRLGMSVTDAQINQAVQNIAQSNRMSLTEFRNALLTEGFDYRKFREDLGRDMLIEQLRMREIQQRVNITDQEVSEHLSLNRQESRKDVEHHLRHIFVSVPEAAGPDTLNATRDRVLAIRQRLLDGADFTIVAAEVSEGQHALEGGDLGWRTFSQMPAQFAGAVEGLGVGDVSAPIRSAVGFHLLLLEAVRGEQRHLVRQAQARHILLRTNVIRSDSEARDTLADVRARILAGEPFADLARSFSEDHKSAADGGALGWIDPRAMPSEFERTLASLQPGEISEPFSTSAGWHVVQLIDRREADDTEKFLRDRAREQLWKIKVENETELWLRRLRDEAYVEYLEPPG